MSTETTLKSLYNQITNNNTVLNEKIRLLDKKLNFFEEKLFSEQKQKPDPFVLIGQDLHLYYKFQNAINELKLPPNHIKETPNTTFIKTFFFITNKKKIFLRLPTKKMTKKSPNSTTK